ncbi:MAG: hypothetical protein ACRC41_03535 [Sarcina sp.]
MIKDIISANQNKKILYLEDITTTYDLSNEIFKISNIIVNLEILNIDLFPIPINKENTHDSSAKYLFTINLKASVHIKYLNQKHSSVILLEELKPLFKIIKIYLPKRINNIDTETFIKKKYYKLNHSIQNIYFRLINSNLLIISILVKVTFKY